MLWSFHSSSKMWINRKIGWTTGQRKDSLRYDASENVQEEKFNDGTFRLSNIEYRYFVNQPCSLPIYHLLLPLNVVSHPRRFGYLWCRVGCAFYIFLLNIPCYFIHFLFFASTTQMICFLQFVFLHLCMAHIRIERIEREMITFLVVFFCFSSCNWKTWCFHIGYFNFHASDLCKHTHFEARVYWHHAKLNVKY